MLPTKYSCLFIFPHIPRPGIFLKSVTTLETSLRFVWSFIKALAIGWEERASKDVTIFNSYWSLYEE